LRKQPVHCAIPFLLPLVILTTQKTRHGL